MPETSLLSHLSNAALVVIALQYVRSTRLYQRFANWLPIANGKVHVIMAGLGGAATSLGMHGSAQGSVTKGWSILLTIPPLWLVLHAIWDWVNQCAIQWFAFKLAVNERAAAPVITVPLPHADATITAPIPHADNLTPAPVKGII